MTNNKIAELIKETEKELDILGRRITTESFSSFKIRDNIVKRFNECQIELSAYKQCQEIIENKCCFNCDNKSTVRFKTIITKDLPFCEECFNSFNDHLEAREKLFLEKKDAEWKEKIEKLKNDLYAIGKFNLNHQEAHKDFVLISQVIKTLNELLDEEEKKC